MFAVLSLASTVSSCSCSTCSALVALAPSRWCGADRLVPRPAGAAYREARAAVALVIVQFVESLGGIRAVQAFRRERRNQAIFEEVDGRYAAANAWTMRLAAVFGPGTRCSARSRPPSCCSSVPSG